MSNSLSDKTIKGVGWSFLDNIANQGITFIVGLLLARLLTPEEYGLLGIVMIFVVLFNTIIDSGISTALIRDNNLSDIDYQTAFYTNVVVSVIMYFILFIISNSIAFFFKEDKLELLCKTMGLLLIVNALSIVQKSILTKKIDFKTQTKISIISSLFSGFIGILMALYDWGVWSLVGQQLSRSIIQTGLLNFYSSWKPKLVFSWNSFVKLFSFGWKIMISSMINSIWNDAYQIVISKCYTPACLGQYTRAKQFSDIFSSNLTSVIQRVSFPSLSEIQNEPYRLKNVYKRILKITMLASFVLLFGLAAISDNLIYVLLGPKWSDAAKYLPIICFQGVFYPINSLNLNILMVKGRSDVYLILEVIKKIIAIIPILLGVFINIYWMLWASVVYGILAFFLNSYFSGKMIRYSTKEQIIDIIPSFLISIIMGICVKLIGMLITSQYISLIVQTIFGILVILTLLKVFKLKEFEELIDICKSYINNKKR